MAGEWIKIEISTPNKPEVIRIARILSVDKDLVFGKLFRFWSWLDANSVDGVVDGLEPQDIDDIVFMPGFGDAIASVGWVEFDKTSGKMVVPNFDSHNGESSKKRALKNKRQARWRKNTSESTKNADVDEDESASTQASTDASTREEKRREKDIRFKPPTVEEVQAYCDERGNGLSGEKIHSHYTASNWYRGKTKIKDWKACVRTWEQSGGSVTNAGDYRQRMKTGAMI